MKKGFLLLAILLGSLITIAHAQVIIDWDDFRNDDDFDIQFHDDDDFDIHWAGFEIGLNNFVTSDYSFNLPAEYSYMDLHTGKSWNININLLEYDIALFGDNFGIGTGMGLEFNDYRFDSKLPIKEGEGQIVVDSSYFGSSINVDKAKLTMTHLTVPLLLEFQVPGGDDDGFFITAGVIGGLRIGSHTKTVVIEDDGDKDKNKNRDDFYLSSFRYGFTARIGYGAVRLFANYYETPLFEKGKGPQIHPYSLGFMVSF
jgi:hypothetical protein